MKGHNALLFQWGSLDWTNPLELNVGKGILSVALTGVEHFNKGFLGLNPGHAHGGKVYANVLLQGDEPGAGAAARGLRADRRRHRRARVLRHPPQGLSDPAC